MSASTSVATQTTTALSVPTLATFTSVLPTTFLPSGSVVPTPFANGTYTNSSTVVISSTTSGSPSTTVGSNPSSTSGATAATSSKPSGASAGKSISVGAVALLGMVAFGMMI
ncbi:hypothetical protein B0J14DRAFT_555282 [Halenospora varia]|nr:hypothetical protein B0J14DRAFT_555282 [Halenospora varia]